MTQLPAWAVRLQAIFLGIGTLLTVLAFQGGISIPSFLTGFFQQGTWDVLVQAATSVFTAYQVIRAIIVGSPKAGVGVSILSVERVRAFAFNPFKLNP